MQGGKRLMETVNCQLALLFLLFSTWMNDFLSDNLIETCILDMMIKRRQRLVCLVINLILLSRNRHGVY